MLSVLMNTVGNMVNTRMIKYYCGTLPRLGEIKPWDHLGEMGHLGTSLDKTLWIGVVAKIGVLLKTLWL